MWSRAVTPLALAQGRALVKVEELNQPSYTQLANSYIYELVWFGMILVVVFTQKLIQFGGLCPSKQLYVDRVIGLGQLILDPLPC